LEETQQHSRKLLKEK
jgi:hypothetical protein